jgi:hypothetical protein
MEDKQDDLTYLILALCLRLHGRVPHRRPNVILHKSPVRSNKFP